MSVSFDCVGPICRTVADAATMYHAITPTGQADDPGSPADSLRVGVLPTTEVFCDTRATPEVQRLFDEAMTTIGAIVREVREGSFSSPDLGGIIDYEAYAFHKPYLTANSSQYNPKTRDSILIGKEITRDKYERMLGNLRTHRDGIRRFFRDVDVLVMPTIPEPAMRIADATDPFAQSGCTFAFSIAGLPAISVPCGLTEAGLPIGLQIVGPPGSEDLILTLAAAYERLTPWHLNRPPMRGE